ncbi:hypothetical protein BG261_08925 [Floricoccus tropicus]|uniref:Knr4/Smi1-like domain-containing protein n=1 Tax=Floricoccus tropicus TaxID=1859473 RepID=A0A1E8GPR2_9LACT|nr:SMI1/KNR4 family protein [Floricoccus tropicus]OFI50234.1 hypothetical protein BG261_08925 [Floricoccus tropicus]
MENKNNKLDILFNKMKKLSKNSDDYFIQSVVDGTVIELSNEFYKPASDDDIKILKNLDFPTEYIDLFTYSNGFKLFHAKYDGLYIGCKLSFYSISEMLFEKKFNDESGFFPNYEFTYPVATLQDTATLYINTEKFNNNQYILIVDVEGENYYYNGTIIDWLNLYTFSFGEIYK